MSFAGILIGERFSGNNCYSSLPDFTPGGYAKSYNYKYTTPRQAQRAQSLRYMLTVEIVVATMDTVISSRIERGKTHSKLCTELYNCTSKLLILYPTILHD